MILTHKKSLITSKYPVITDYGQLQPGMLLEGCIYSIKDFGVFVRFFNNVQVMFLTITVNLSYIVHN